MLRTQTFFGPREHEDDPKESSSCFQDPCMNEGSKREKSGKDGAVFPPFVRFHISGVCKKFFSLE